uniref:(California timema) hypothetical protein n=1 Tax=Timema californicum TaxID=61474 RepID=A0A7R9J5G4_TIMCA|nr:unnamed protein product [Timema californicum]
MVHDNPMTGAQPINMSIEPAPGGPREKASVYYCLVWTILGGQGSKLKSRSKGASFCLLYSSPMASLVLTDSSQLTSDRQHLGWLEGGEDKRLKSSQSLAGQQQNRVVLRVPLTDLGHGAVERFEYVDSGAYTRCTVSKSFKVSYSSPTTSLVLTESSQLTVFEKLPDKVMYPYAEQYELQKHFARALENMQDGHRPSELKGLNSEFGLRMTKSLPAFAWRKSEKPFRKKQPSVYLTGKLIPFPQHRPSSPLSDNLDNAAIVAGLSPIRWTPFPSLGHLWLSTFPTLSISTYDCVLGTFLGPIPGASPETTRKIAPLCLVLTKLWSSIQLKTAWTDPPRLNELFRLPRQVMVSTTLTKIMSLFGTKVINIEITCSSMVSTTLTKIMSLFGTKVMQFQTEEAQGFFPNKSL